MDEILFKSLINSRSVVSKAMMCTQRAADISEIKINSSYLLEFNCSFRLSIVKFAPEPQVNLRNHLPPGDLFFSSLHTGKIPLFAIVGAARYSHAPNKKFFLQKESPWPARVRMSAQRSLWPALIAKNVITSPGRIAATIQIVWNLRSSVLVARHQLFTAKPVN